MVADLRLVALQLSRCGIFPDQGLNPGSLHWQMGLYPLCHQGSPTSSVFKIIAMLVDKKWYLTLVLICISLIMNDAKHVFICLLNIPIAFR